jgi:DNA-binding NarL/FixJ family response regulator
MTASPAPRNGSSLAVGVYDEPELIVSGVDGLLSRSGPPAAVVTITPDAPAAVVDVLLCDPIGRDVELEDYLSLVAGLTAAPVLVYTWSTSRSSLRRSLAAGARGVVSKSSSGHDLAAAVTAVHRGATVAPPLLAAASNRAADLSVREAQVLELICRGMSNLEIADQLFVSVNSVKTYVRQVYQKTGVTRRAQAVAWGLARGY